MNARDRQDLLRLLLTNHILVKVGHELFIQTACQQPGSLSFLEPVQVPAAGLQARGPADILSSVRQVGLEANSHIALVSGGRERRTSMLEFD